MAIFQMMFVSGETAEPSAETTSMIEEIVRQQVIEMVSFWATRHSDILLIFLVSSANVLHRLLVVESARYQQMI
jgi:hypothetical protein